MLEEVGPEGETLHMKGWASRKYSIKTLKESNHGVSKEFLTPKRDHI